MLAEEIPPAIQWHEGMLLAPQHFQQGFGRHESLAQYNALAAAPYAWGARRLTLDSKLLPGGTFRVLELEATLPDGALIAHRAARQGGGDGELSLDLTPYSNDMKQRGVMVHLAVPAGGFGAVKGPMARFDAIDGDPVADDNTGEGGLRMPRLRLRRMLMAGPAPPPKYVSLPLARVRFSNETFGLDDYVAPVTLAGPRSPLTELCSGLVARVREKAMYVSEQVRAPAAMLDMRLMLENRARMQALTAGLPAMECLLATGSAHPLPLYLALCGMAGQLAALSASLLPPVFPPYDHADLRTCFQEVADYCHRMTSEGVPETYRAQTMVAKDGVFSLPFDGAWANRRIVLGLRMATGTGEKETIQWGDEALIGSAGLIARLREKRIRGAWRQFIETDQELSPVRGLILFSLKPDAEFVRPGEALQIVHYGERGRPAAPLEIILYVRQEG